MLFSKVNPKRQAIDPKQKWEREHAGLSAAPMFTSATSGFRDEVNSVAE